MSLQLKSTVNYNILSVLIKIKFQKEVFAVMPWKNLGSSFRQHFLKEACFSFCKGIANYDAVSTMCFYLTDLSGSGIK